MMTMGCKCGVGEVREPSPEITHCIESLLYLRERGGTGKCRFCIAKEWASEKLRNSALLNKSCPRSMWYLLSEGLVQVRNVLCLVSIPLGADGAKSVSGLCV